MSRVEHSRGFTSQAVIPAKAGIQFRNTGFRVKPGMTNEVKGFMVHCTNKPQRRG